MRLRLLTRAMAAIHIVLDMDFGSTGALAAGKKDVKGHAVGGLVGRFQFVIAQGDYVGGKPHPAPFLKAAERLGVAPESCVALEDSYHGVRSAAGAGMMTIMVPDLFPPTDDMKELCVGIAQDLHEVCTFMTSAA